MAVNRWPIPHLEEMTHMTALKKMTVQWTKGREVMNKGNQGI